MSTVLLKGFFFEGQAVVFIGITLGYLRLLDYFFFRKAAEQKQHFWRFLFLIFLASTIQDN